MNSEEPARRLSRQELEALLRSLRPDPAPQFSLKLEQRYAPSNRRPLLARRNLLIAAILLLALAFGLTPTGRVLAQRITDFFRFSESTQRTQIVSLTPRPSPDPGYPYNQFALSLEEAQAAAGFEFRTLHSHLTSVEGWQLHGFSYQASHNQVQQLYTYRSQADVGIYLYISAQTAFYEEDWGACPNATLQAVQVNGQSAELLEGAVWTTYEEATPGAQREWRCEAVGGLAMSLRWLEEALYYQISLTQLETRSDLLFEPEDLVALAEELR